MYSRAAVGHVQATAAVGESRGGELGVPSGVEHARAHLERGLLTGYGAHALRQRPCCRIRLLGAARRLEVRAGAGLPADDQHRALGFLAVDGDVCALLQELVREVGQWPGNAHHVLEGVDRLVHVTDVTKVLGLLGGAGEIPIVGRFEVRLVK